MILCLFCCFVGDQSQKPYISSDSENPAENPACSQQPLANLCNPGPVVNDHWILQVPARGCNLFYTAISNSTQETITIDNCLAIYNCWLPFSTVSICFYRHFTDDTPVEPNRQLKLVWISAKNGKWSLSQSPQSVLTYGHYAGNISSSVDLYGIVNDESGDNAAVFLMGKDYNLLRVKLLPLGANERRFTKACGRSHEVIKVSTTKHDVMVVCDNGVYWMRIGRWKPVKAIAGELADVTFTRASVNSYAVEYSNISVGLIAVNTDTNLEYCFIGPLSHHPISQCGSIPNVYLAHGMLVSRSDFSDIQFLAVLNEGLLAVINMSSNDSYVTIDTEFCYPQGDCYSVQTENMVYVGNQQQKTMVLYKDTFRLNATWNSSVHNILPIVEKYLDQHDIQLSPSLSTSTNTLISNTMRNSEIKETTTSTGFTTTTTNLTTMSTGMTATSTGLTISTDLINTSIDLTTPTDLNSTFITINSSTSTQTDNATVNYTPPRISSSAGNPNSTMSNDNKSETTTLVFAIIVVVLVLVTFLGLLAVITLLVIRYCKCGQDVSKSNHFKMDHREVTLSQESIQTKAPLQTAERNEGEVVMISPETRMYSQRCTSTMTATDSTVVSTTSNTTTKIVKSSSTTVTERKILVE